MIELRHLFRFNQIYMFIRSRECKTVPLEMTNLAFFEKLLICQVSAYNLLKDSNLFLTELMFNRPFS